MLERKPNKMNTGTNIGNSKATSALRYADHRKLGAASPQPPGHSIDPTLTNRGNMPRDHSGKAP